MTRRAAWPTVGLTLVALLGVLTVLLVTGTSTSRPTRFVLSATPASQSVSSGGTAQFRIDVTASGSFQGRVTLSTTALPDGVTATFSTNSVTLTKLEPTASVTLTISTGSGIAAGPVGVGLVGRSGRNTETSALTLQINPTGITDAGPPPSPMTGTGGLGFAVTGDPGTGVLAPGASIPLDLRVTNPNRQRLEISRLEVTVVSTSKPGCRASNFAIVQYAGHYPLSVPAGVSRSLAELAVPAGQWPQLRMLDLPSNQDACKGVTLNLRYLGTGSGS